MRSGDPRVSALIRSALGPMAEAAADLRRAYEDGTTRNLIDFLRSDDEISPADRDLLADLLAGELGRRRGRQRLKASTKDRRAEAIAAYRQRMSARPTPRKEDVLQSIADDLDFTFEQMSDFVRKASKCPV